MISLGGRMCYFWNFLKKCVFCSQEDSVFPQFRPVLPEFITHGKLWTFWFQVSFNQNNIWNIISVLLLLLINCGTLEPGRASETLLPLLLLSLTAEGPRPASSLLHRHPPHSPPRPAPIPQWLPDGKQTLLREDRARGLARSSGLEMELRSVSLNLHKLLFST